MNDLRDIILLGEVHGTEANIWALQFMVRYLQANNREVVVALELPVDWGDALEQLNTGDSDAFKALIGKQGEEYQSGRISGKHIAAYEVLAKQGVMFYSIREDGDDWNDTDARMAENIRQVSEDSPGAVILVTIGNMHAQKTSFKANWLPGDYRCHPVGEVLSEDVSSIMIRYQDCKYRNFEIGDILNDKPVAKDLLSNGAPTLFCGDLSGADYDCELWVQNADAV